MAGKEPIVSGMAGRYATALFELALESNAIDAVKAVARFETSSNADEGVARAIERFVLQ